MKFGSDGGETPTRAAAWRDAAAAGLPASDPKVRALAARHVAGIGTAWGGAAPTAELVRSLAQLYVDDERFAANCGGPDGAACVRDAVFAATA